MSYSFGTKYESWDLAKRAIEEIKNVLSMYVRDSKTTPRIVETEVHFRLYNVFCIHYKQES